MLFATLDPTTRRVILPGGKKVLFSDTVGFIQKLPTKLVASFRASLEELKDADVILHVVDAASPIAAQQVHSVQSIIEDEEAGATSQILVLNKADAVVVGANDGASSKPATGGGGGGADGIMSAEELNGIIFGDTEEADWAELHEFGRPQQTVSISALHGYGLEELLTRVEEALLAQAKMVEVLLPYSSGDLLSEIHKVGTIISEEFQEEGTMVKAYVPVSLHNRLESFHLVKVEKHYEPWELV
eukprot:CAMPEP_0185762860 /NCGR_PEP_ID=MMETSP1174-20130828/21823_1 /TAXON_ID=35687 /ORGANISM="Dictyocha speculum, Strain CCMP1381" /LENGTH=243 /DNA_ID=CAMNT_0028444715 /DNA_START=158 /DNA_END=889 /DNA_ORIENTATION=+